MSNITMKATNTEVDAHRVMLRSQLRELFYLCRPLKAIPDILMDEMEKLAAYLTGDNEADVMLRIAKTWKLYDYEGWSRLHNSIS